VQVERKHIYQQRNDDQASHTSEEVFRKHSLVKPRSVNHAHKGSG
jgi:hypothetical protein